MTIRYLLVFGFALGMLIALPGCASVSTISAASHGTPKVYSGTRLDLHALADDDVALRRFPVPPPRHALLDLPFSAVADTFLLPMTMPVAAYETVF